MIVHVGTDSVSVDYHADNSPLNSPITGAFFSSITCAIGAGVGAALFGHHVGLEMLILWCGGFISGVIWGATGGLLWRMGGRSQFVSADGFLHFCVNLAAPALGLAIFPLDVHLPSYLALLFDLFVGLLVVSTVMIFVVIFGITFFACAILPQMRVQREENTILLERRGQDPRTTATAGETTAPRQA